MGGVVFVDAGGAQLHVAVGVEEEFLGEGGWDNFTMPRKDDLRQHHTLSWHNIGLNRSTVWHQGYLLRLLGGLPRLRRTYEYFESEA